MSIPEARRRIEMEEVRRAQLQRVIQERQEQVAQVQRDIAQREQELAGLTAERIQVEGQLRSVRAQVIGPEAVEQVEELTDRLEDLYRERLDLEAALAGREDPAVRSRLSQVEAQITAAADELRAIGGPIGQHVTLYLERSRLAASRQQFEAELSRLRHEEAAASRLLQEVESSAAALRQQRDQLAARAQG
ncbi:MAG: hypothetical protein PHZ19_10050 [Candidatus Thermoplasmatota archaeon]|nr:hypothetical protein [Candidatus Thermoplasmatota archaeon]